MKITVDSVPVEIPEGLFSARAIGEALLRTRDLPASIPNVTQATLDFVRRWCERNPEAIGAAAISQRNLASFAQVASGMATPIRWSAIVQYALMTVSTDGDAFGVSVEPPANAPTSSLVN
jgi:hypothetical protein